MATQVQEATMDTTAQAQPPALQLQAHPDYSYVPRTKDNAHMAAVTVAFAVDFNTAGERLTKREAGPRYIGIPFGSDVAAAADALAAFIVKRGGSTLNVAGNGIYTMAEHGVNQARCNTWVRDVLALVVARVKLTLIRSGGQTGIDQAGLVAALALGVPALGYYPKTFRRRNAQGQEISATVDAIRAELEEQAAELRRACRSFHADGTLPMALDGHVFVFGSNLAGRHGKGAAAVAREQFGAQPGVGPGRQGQSYGIPTKDGRPLPGNPRPSFNDPEQTLALTAIKLFIDEFIEYAKAHPDERFFVTRVGCGLAGYEDAEVAPMFAAAPSNCCFPEDWKQWLVDIKEELELAPAVNIWSGASGLPGALTNMSERAREKGCIKHSYPVKVNGVTYPDSEAAYRALKVHGATEYNDGLMIDLIALKFVQNNKLFERVTQNGGAAWLEKCSHFTQARSERAQSWEGQGNGSRFIRNLIHGYLKAKTGTGPVTRVVHVRKAPFDEYIGRKCAEFAQSEFHNPFPIEGARTRDMSVQEFWDYLNANPELKAKARLLKGRTIGCWCKDPEHLDSLCHGDTLAAVAEGREWVPPQVAQGSLF
ncbi:DUF4326 domain-containing protein [Paraburkholderia sp. EG287A]|uniref:A1S_2505 family phage non-structural protein n=1 Tax=Paraburkholderia sp. EG287A TaxID=3237012 RepID=UPI0034D25EDD